MLNEDYEVLINYLEEMMSDGVQLTHGGHLIDWSDTEIPQILRQIRSQQIEQKSMLQEQLEPGSLLQNVCTGQKVTVIYQDDKSVHLNPVEKVLIYPKDKLWQHFEKAR